MKRLARSLAVGLVVAGAAAPYAVAQGLPDIVWTVAGHTGGAEGLAFSVDGTRIASGGGYPDCAARIWSASGGTLEQSFAHYPHAVLSVDLGPVRPELAVGYIVSGYPPGGEARTWDTLEGGGQHTYAGCFVAFSPDGQYLASGGGGVNRYVDISRVSNGGRLQHLLHGAYLHDIAYSPDGAIVASAGSDNTVKLWDPESGALLRTLAGHTDDVATVAFSPDGQTLVSCGRDGLYPSPGATIKIWRLADGEVERYYEESALAIAVAPDGLTFAYGRPDGSVALASMPGQTVGVAHPASSPAAGSVLRAPWPNPLATFTSVGFELTTASSVRLLVHDVSGRRVATLMEGPVATGSHRLTWDGRDDHGSPVAAGTYVLSLETSTDRRGSKITVIR